MDEQTWLKQQAALLLDAGVNPLDAEEAIRLTLSALPDEDVNLLEWLPARDVLAVVVDEKSIHDARVAWYADVEAKHKRMLDARSS